jgi:hypothetical protein
MTLIKVDVSRIVKKVIFNHNLITNAKYVGKTSIVFRKILSNVAIVLFKMEPKNVIKISY